MFAIPLFLFQLLRFSPQAMFVAATQGYPQPLTTPETWSSTFQDFVRLCLQPKPGDRPTAEQLLQHPFLLKKCNRALIRLLVAYVQPPETSIEHNFES